MLRWVPDIGNIKRGFTLIEIMLALLVITIGIVAVTGLLGTSLDSSAKSHDDLNVVSFADMVFNYLHSVTNFAEIPTAGTVQIPDYAEGMADISIGTLSEFTCQVPTPGGLSQEYTVSYAFDAQVRGNDVKEFTLRVWPGYGTNGNPRIFYTEIYNWVKTL